MKRIMWSSLLLGLWLMLAPFVLELVNRAVVKVLWEDLILGFGIACFSLCRLLSRRSQEIAIADWIVTVLGFLTLVNPFLYSYCNLTVAISEQRNHWRCCVSFSCLSRLEGLLMDRRSKVRHRAHS